MAPLIAVTGATGFAGRALCAGLLAARRFRVRRLLRVPDAPQPDCEDTVLGDLAEAPAAALSSACRGADAVVHLAARTHVMRERDADPAQAYRRSNVDATRGLASAARAEGVRRFVFLSSIKVNGEATRDAPYTEAAAPRPEDEYGRSKLEAERALAGLCAQAGMQHVILRAPLIYGPGVKGNLLALTRAVARGVPLPFAAIDNRRSLLGLDNLVSALIAAIEHSGAPGRTFLLSDGEDLSTPHLVRLIAEAMGKPARLVSVPVPLLRLAGALAGRGDAIRRLTGSLQVDSGLMRRTLDWQPAVPPAEGLARMVRWYDQAIPCR